MATLRLSKEHFTTSTIIDWMDVFTRPLYKHIIVDSLKYCQDSKGHISCRIANADTQCGRITNPPERVVIYPY